MAQRRWSHTELADRVRDAGSGTARPGVDECQCIAVPQQVCLTDGEAEHMQLW